MLIDSLGFSRGQQTVRGILPVAELARLHDSLFGAPRAGSTVSYEVRGGANAREQPMLWLTVSGQLQLQCQRCLKALDYDLVIDTTLRLVAESLMGIDMSDDPDEPDCIAASSELDVVALIEDEILLALPAYPRHEDGSCTGTAGEAGTNKVSAFGALNQLRTLEQKAIKSKE